jgi:UDP-2,3-diacylglucosamine pyrophosphatase LpxH
MQQEEEVKVHTASDDETIAHIMLNLDRPSGGIRISEPVQHISESSSEAEELDPKDKGKGIMKQKNIKKKKKKFTLAQLREIKIAEDAELARKQQAEYDAEYLKEASKPITRKQMNKAQERKWMISFLKGRGYKNLQRLRYPEVKTLWDNEQELIKREVESIVPMDVDKGNKLEEIRKEQAEKRKLKRKKEVQDDQLSKRLKMLHEDTIDELRNYFRVVDFENKKTEDSGKKSKIISFSMVESKEGNYLMFNREDESFTVFNMLWDVLHFITREDLYDLYLQVQTYYEEIEATGVGLILFGDLITIWETEETSVDTLWNDQENWEITRWRFFESSGVHSLEMEDGTMIYMLAERRYPLIKEIMLRMLDHGMELEDESDVALDVIKLFIR